MCGNGNKGTAVTLIDTAGITRQAKLKMGSLERSTVLWSLKVVERAHVVILLIDPVKGITSQDQTLADHILDNFKSGKKGFCVRIKINSCRCG